MKILLFGKNGQVGHELQRTLLPLGRLTSMGRDEVDLINSDHLTTAIYKEAPDIIVNAAAYTAVDKAEAHQNIASKINAESVAVMAQYAAHTGALLVQYSTDYVFDGEKAGAYVESDITNPQNAYGRSKLAGEEAILSSGCEAFIFRTSWVFSAHGENFVKTIIRLAKERDTLSIVADQRGAPTSAELIADVTSLAVAAYRNNAISTGIYHLSCSGEVTWHGLASHIVGALQTSPERSKLKMADIHPIATDDYPLPAKRPKNSRLDTSKLSKALHIEIPHWTIYVDRTLAQLSEAER